ncbi:hypothetical protein BC829DRAFT_415331 [Chytridium lagenaria]|nr:hypothetical protein BC829DRAFT_415331 [Chytridium lagenaria]
MGADNRLPDFKDNRCVGKSAMEICDSRSDCGGFTCWEFDTSSNPVAKNCYLFVAPMFIGAAEGLGAWQNAYIKAGAEVSQDGAIRTPFPTPSPTSQPSPPSESPSQGQNPQVSNQPDQGPISQVDGNSNPVTTTQLSADAPDPTFEVISSSGVLPSLSGGRTMSGVLVALDATVRSSNDMLPNATPGLNGLADGGSITSNGNPSSGSNNTLVIGISSVAATVGVVGAVAFAVLLRRRKTRNLNPAKTEPLSFSKSGSTTAESPQPRGGESFVTYGNSKFGHAEVSNSYNGSERASITGTSSSEIATHSNYQAPVVMPTPIPKATEAFSERSRITPSPTQSSALFSSANVTPSYSQGSYIARPEKQSQPAIEVSHHQQSQSQFSSRVSMAPPYMPNDAASGSHNVTALADVKAPRPSRGAVVQQYNSSNASPRADSSRAPIVAAPAATGISKSAYIRQTDTQSMHPQAWNTRHTVNWLHNKGISARIITLFETNRIRGNELGTWTRIELRFWAYKIRPRMSIYFWRRFKY